LSTTNSFQITVYEVNTAPVLDPIADGTVHVCQTFRGTAHARDVDFPPNTLTYEPLCCAPPEMSIDTNSGAISWAPNESQMGVWPVTVKVTDSSLDYRSPHLSATQTFYITVLSSDPVLQISLSNGMAHLSWNACPGTSYRVLYTNELNEPHLNFTNWPSLLGDVLASGGTARKTDPTAGVTNRFYGLRVQP
jgi:hypothetical protein